MTDRPIDQSIYQINHIYYKPNSSLPRSIQSITSLNPHSPGPSISQSFAAWCHISACVIGPFLFSILDYIFPWYDLVLKTTSPQDGFSRTRRRHEGKRDSMVSSRFSTPWTCGKQQYLEVGKPSLLNLELWTASFNMAMLFTECALPDSPGGWRCFWRHKSSNCK